MTHHCATFQGASKAAGTTICFYAFGGRIVKLLFLGYFAWTAGVVPTAILVATSFPVKVFLWRYVPSGREYVFSFVGFGALPILGVTLFFWA